MEQRPRYKAAVTKAVLDEVDKLSAEQRDAVLERLDPTDVSAVRHAGRTAWLDARIQASLDTAILAVLGAAGHEDLMRRYTLGAVDTPIFAPIARGALKLFGAGAGSVFKTLPRTWPFISRGCGDLLVTEVERGVSVTYAGLPEALRTEGFASANRGSFWGMLEFVRVEGATIDTDLSELEQGTVRHQIRWQ